MIADKSNWTGIGMFGRVHRCLSFLPIALGIVCAPAVAEKSDNDPLEGFNRAVFAFNEQADRFVLKPIAQGYRFVTPDPIERGVGRIFSNLGEILNVANSLLQGKMSQAANDSGRFLVNTTIGLGGIFDVADDFGLKQYDDEDFGQTLGAWGVGSGPYLVLPLFGPSSLRDAPARLVDGYANPINTVDHVPTRNTIYGVQVVSTRAALLDTEKLISGDKYTFIRDVYLQRRDYLVSDGALEDAFGDDYQDQDDSDDYFEY